MFQYLGSRGAQHISASVLLVAGQFQYLGSRGAQRPRGKRSVFFTCFNTWAREEPNSGLRGHGAGISCFNTWAREEPNILSSGTLSERTCFNTWAREEPNKGSRAVDAFAEVSILGLARSPTCEKSPNRFQKMFQYLGSRGAQPGLP